MLGWAGRVYNKAGRTETKLDDCCTYTAIAAPLSGFAGIFSVALQGSMSRCMPLKNIFRDRLNSVKLTARGSRSEWLCDKRYAFSFIYGSTMALMCDEFESEEAEFQLRFEI